MAGLKISGEDFLLTFHQKPNVFKAAVIVAKKIAPKAVDRNRLRRQIFEVLRRTSKEGELIVNVKKNLAGLKTPQIERRLRPLLNKIG